nr:hypothetical protein Iba_chr02fCG9630 [Ipomoea batatas]
MVQRLESPPAPSSVQQSLRPPPMVQRKPQQRGPAGYAPPGPRRIGSDQDRALPPEERPGYSEGPSAELVHQVLPDRSSGDCCENGFAGLLTSTNVTGEQDGIGEDLLSQIRALQDPPPGLFGSPELALELLDPLIPLGEGLFKGRHFSTVDFVPIFSPGEEISDRAMRSPTRAVDHPLVFSGGGAAAQILDSRAAGGSSPCFISTSITGVVEPDPSRRERFAVRPLRPRLLFPSRAWRPGPRRDRRSGWRERRGEPKTKRNLASISHDPPGMGDPFLVTLNHFMHHWRDFMPFIPIISYEKCQLCKAIRNSVLLSIDMLDANDPRFVDPLPAAVNDVSQGPSRLFSACDPIDYVF